MALDKDALTQHIRQQIPLADGMDFSISQLDEQGITVHAPLSPNINVHGTGFAGSLYSLSALAAWAYTTHLVEQNGVDADIVMAQAEIRYRRPVVTDIECVCHCDAEVGTAFLQHLEQKGRARLSLVVEIGADDDVVFSATMVAIQRA
jgi:thioesterase domain-containing protein